MTVRWMLCDWRQAKTTQFLLEVQQYTYDEKIAFTKLRMHREALLWWENLCKCRQIPDATQALMWDKFKFVVKDNFYLINYH